MKMRETDGAQLPIVESFGAELERAMRGRAGTRRRSQRRALVTVCAAGLVAVSLMTAPGQAATGAVGEWLGLAEPGDPPTVDSPRTRAGGGAGQEPTGSVVVASGRAPDGARYEFVVEAIEVPAGMGSPHAERQRCLNIEWPDARSGQISPQFGCFPAFPPAEVDDLVVRPGGAMYDETYTRDVQIAGLARSDVGDVEIRYEGRDGTSREAEVDFARVAGDVRQRAGADGPFGVFLAFLPHDWMGYGANLDPRHCPPEERPYDPDAIEVIAYDDHGEVIARMDGNNILSTGGRPPCG
jgi:hypothetical protein